MGLTRQAVQRLANEMKRDGLVQFGPNPHHQRAKLILLTPAGKAAHDAAMKRQGPWASRLAAGLGTARIGTVTATLRRVRQRLDDEAAQGTDDA